MVDLRNPKYPGLIRMSKGSIQAFHPAYPGEWEESPYHYAMWYGEGPFMDYDDCTEKEARKYMEIIRENVRRYKAEAPLLNQVRAEEALPNNKRVLPVHGFL